MGDRLKDKVALVSGAGSSGPGWGSGKATAMLFAREGAKVLAADLKLDAAVETKRIIEREGGICEVVAGNVSRADDVAAIVGACIRSFGRIDVLHNCPRRRSRPGLLQQPLLPLSRWPDGVRCEGSQEGLTMPADMISVSARLPFEKRARTS
jgi:NAD(P)-dependent dehydrogenase (short-subunit alcohol dehydrogenase family)